MHINTAFTLGRSPYEMFEYEKADVVLKHRITGKTIFEMYGVEVPKHWSTNARTTLVSKYLRRAGVPTILVPRKELELPTWLQPHMAAEGSELGGETSVKQVVHRIVGHWAYTGWRHNYFDTIDDAGRYYNEMVFMILNQMAAPNSPQWFNTGLWWAYGIEGRPQGHYYVNLPNPTKMLGSVAIGKLGGSIGEAQRLIAKYVEQSPNAYEYVQAHACFSLSLQDTMLEEDGILDWYHTEARIFKFGSGAGVNVSNLRGEGEPLAGGGTSSGCMSFVKVADASAGAIKSGGTTRRAAKMVQMNIDHPEIEKFIDAKVDAELKAAALYTGSKLVTKHCTAIVEAAKSSTDPDHDPKVRALAQEASKAGVPDDYIERALQLNSMHESWMGRELSLDFEGDIYQTVPFQNANHTVRISADFYDAVDHGRQWNLTARLGGSTVKSLPAAELEHKLALATWMCGDPGVQFDDIINSWNVTPNDARINTSNPCGEHHRPDDSACNLKSFRLTKFLEFDGSRHRFAYKMFRHAVNLAQMTLDITCSMAHLPTMKSAMSVYMYRDTGLGFADLGSLLMTMGLPYDSATARAFAGLIAATMQGQCHLTSATLAQSLGAYPRFHANRDEHLRSVRNHMRAVHVLNTPYEALPVSPVPIDTFALEMIPDAINMLQDTQEMWQTAYDMGFEHGYRNAEMTVIAPTGTIALLMDCDTTGVEPMFALKTDKKLAGGGQMVLAPATPVEQGLVSLGYSPSHCTALLAELNERGVMPSLRPEHQAVFHTAVANGPGDTAISWQAHLGMMAAVQSFVSGAISKTINMPHDATVEDIKQAYRTGYSLGCKAIAIYRDGSKLSQPLQVVKASPEDAAVVDDGSESIIEKTQSLARDIDKLIRDAAKKGQLVSPVQCATRVRLPAIRTAGINVAAQLEYGTLYVQTTRYPDGKLGEIWMNYSADQGIIQALIGQVCRLANVAMQYGVPAESILRTMMDSKFPPNGMVGNHPMIKMCTSVLNLGARLIAYHELGDESVVDIHPEIEAAPAPVPHTQPKSGDGLMSDLRSVKLTGELCPTCGSSRYVTSGAGCKRCMDCGNSGGCGG